MRNSAAHSDSRPNILLIIGDDMGFSDVGAFGSSERTLQNAFRDIMGLSPLTFLQRLRLHRARDKLRKAKRGSTTVTDVAMNWGFWHFSDFSQAYRNCFDELPPETLKRDSQNE